LNARAAEAGSSAVPIAPSAALVSLSNRASGTFTPIYDADLALDLKPTSAMLLWTVLNRFWSMRSPLYTPGQAKLMKHTGLSKKTIERVLKVLEANRACRFHCGREHPLVLVRWNGMGHNATILPFTCDLTVPMKPRGLVRRDANPQVAALRRSPRREPEEDQNDAPLLSTEASDCRPIASQTDASPTKVVRQSDASSIGKEKPILETAARDTHAAAFKNDWNEARLALAHYGIQHEMIVILIDKHGPASCIRQAEALPYRTIFAASSNRAGLLVRAIQSGWDIPKGAEDAEARRSATERLRSESELEERKSDAARIAHAARLAEIARSVRAGDLSVDAALLAIHGRAFDKAVDVAAIQRRIAQNQFAAANSALDCCAPNVDGSAPI